MSRKSPGSPEPRTVRSNRRGEPRTAAAGLGWMEPLDSPEHEEFQLLDISPSGFRASHRYQALSAGQKVRFYHPRAEGVAVAVWNRVAEGAVESGFLILPGRK